MISIMFLLTLLIATTMALPHVSMLDTPTVRDIGLIFEHRDYKGRSTFLIETINEPTCIPINVDATGEPQGLQIESIQICKPTTCTFFTNKHCQVAAGQFSVSCEGPGDVPNHESDDIYKSYICGNTVNGADKLVTVPHDPNAGMS